MILIIMVLEIHWVGDTTNHPFFLSNDKMLKGNYNLSYYT